MKQFSFIPTSIWSDETFRQMSPEHKIIMLYLLEEDSKVGVKVKFHIELLDMAYKIGLHDEAMKNAFSSFLLSYPKLISFFPETSEVQINF